MVQLDTDPLSEKRELSQRNESTLQDNWNSTYNRGLDDEYGRDSNVALDDINDADLSFIETNRSRPSYKGQSNQVYVPPNIYDPNKIQQ